MHLYFPKWKHYPDFVLFVHLCNCVEFKKSSVKELMRDFLLFVDRNEAEKRRNVRRCRTELVETCREAR